VRQKIKKKEKKKEFPIKKHKKIPKGLRKRKKKWSCGNHLG
jgi:hypothetical protein